MKPTSNKISGENVSSDSEEPSFASSLNEEVGINNQYAQKTSFWVFVFYLGNKCTTGHAKG